MERAQILVRTFEAAAQELYDSAATLLTTTQRVRRVELSESWRGRDESYYTLETLSSSLDSILEVTTRNLENLLVVGEEQANILERCDQSPIEWMMSQRSLVATILANEDLDDMSNDQRLCHTTPIYDNDESNRQSDQSSTPPPVPSGKPIPGARDSNWPSVEDEGTSWLCSRNEETYLTDLGDRPRIGTYASTT